MSPSGIGAEDCGLTQLAGTGHVGKARWASTGTIGDQADGGPRAPAGAGGPSQGQGTTGTARRGTQVALVGTGLPGDPRRALQGTTGTA